MNLILQTQLNMLSFVDAKLLGALIVPAFWTFYKEALPESIACVLPI